MLSFKEITNSVPFGNGADVVRFTTPAGDFIRKGYGLEYKQSLVWEHNLINWLTSAGLPFLLPNPVPTEDGSTWTETDGKLFVIYPFVEGEPLAYQNLGDVRLLAEATARLHETLESCPMQDRPGPALFKNPIEFARTSCDPFTLTSQTLRVSSSSQANGSLSFWNEAASQIRSFLDGRFRELPCLICHNDLTSGNVLKTRNQIAAVLDFEFACKSPRALDIAMGLRMTMRPWENPNPWAPLRVYAAGYRSIRPAGLTAEEVQCLPELLILRSASSVFLRLSRLREINDHENTIAAIERVRSTTNWLDGKGREFLEIAAECFQCLPRRSSVA